MPTARSPGGASKRRRQPRPHRHRVDVGAKGLFLPPHALTEYIVLGRHHGPERIGESETYYRGYVHAPGVESRLGLLRDDDRPV